MKRITLLRNSNQLFKQRPAAASNGTDLDLCPRPWSRPRPPRPRPPRPMADGRLCVCVCVCVCVDRIVVIGNVIEITTFAQSVLSRTPGSQLDIKNDLKWMAYSESSSKTGLDKVVKDAIPEKKAFLDPTYYTSKKGRMTPYYIAT